MDKIICVGKNYLDHAKELGDAVPEKPVIFLKPPSVLKTCHSSHDTLIVHYPDVPHDEVHAECEIVLLIKEGGYQIKLENAHHYIDAVALGLDMTLRIRQTQLKKLGHPWTTAKVFRDAAIVGPWQAASQFPNYMSSIFNLRVNDKIKQSAKGNDMTMKPDALIAYVSHYFPLCAGDIIFTGTPAGVSAIFPQDILTLAWGSNTFTVKFKTTS